MEKDQKELLKACKKQIKISNWAAQGFMHANNYMPGSYEKLQSTDIWNRAKQHLLEYYRLKNIELICPFCNSVILNNPTLHHKTYNWKRLFSPKNVIFLHGSCHTKLHAEKRGYKKGTWKKVGKGMLRAFFRPKRWYR